MDIRPSGQRDKETMSRLTLKLQQVTHYSKCVVDANIEYRFPANSQISYKLWDSSHIFITNNYRVEKTNKTSA